MRTAIAVMVFISFQVHSQILLYDDFKQFVYDSRVTTIALSHNNRFIAYGVKESGEITVIDLKVQKRLHLLNVGSKMDLYDLLFDRNDQYLVGAFEDKKIIIWDLISGNEEKSISSYGGKIHGIDIAGNNEMMAVFGNLDDIYLYHFPSGELKGSLKNGHRKKMIGCSFSRSGDQLVSLATDQQMIFWNCSDLRMIRKSDVNPVTMDGSGTKVTAMNVGEVSDVIAVAFEETLLDKGGNSMIFKYNIALYDWKTATLIQIIEGNVKKMDRLQLSPDGSHILADNSTLSETRLSFWNRKSGTFDQKQIIKGKILCFTLSADGTLLAIGYDDQFNKEGTYIATFKISGMEFKQDYTAQKAVSTTGLNSKPPEKEVYPKAYTGDLNSVGKYYALIIGVNNYEDEAITDLDAPLKDASNLYNILVNTYTFDVNNVLFLQDPKRTDIIVALDNLEKSVTEEDNLLIFYAGHGHWDPKTQKGYWLPSDALQDNTANWIRNSTLSDYISSIKSKHTLLIADACFSGSIFKTRDAFGNMDKGIQRLYGLPSRKAMTSGALQMVPDQSVFLNYLTKRLVENEDHYLSSEQLFFSFKKAVLNNSTNVPQFGEIGNAGDEGGDFIFIRKDAK